MRYTLVNTDGIRFQNTKKIKAFQSKKQNKTKQNKTKNKQTIKQTNKQNKKKQNKTKQKQKQKQKTPDFSKSCFSNLFIYFQK